MIQKKKLKIVEKLLRNKLNNVCLTMLISSLIATDTCSPTQTHRLSRSPSQTTRSEQLKLANAPPDKLSRRAGLATEVTLELHGTLPMRMWTLASSLISPL